MDKPSKHKHEFQIAEARYNRHAVLKNRLQCKVCYKYSKNWYTIKQLVGMGFVDAEVE